ncbi:serine protease [Bengtsoniella intestinalis]|uniref:S1C family serine protease n=1 Tax=Bengtsoniella intestinalis TaxID=3073143 RepID=UPI00391FC69B
MKRKLLAIFCTCALLLSLSVSVMATTPDPMAISADTLYTLGLLDGSASSYDLSSTPSRLTGVTMLVRLAGAETTAQSYGKSAGFTDVPAGAESSVNYAYGQNWVNGVSATTFGSYQGLTANAYCAMILRMLGYDDSQGDFSIETAALFAQRLGILRDDVVPADGLTMGDLCNISLDILTVTYRDSEETILDRLLSTGAVETYVVNALGLNTTEYTAREISDQYQAAVFSLDCYYTEKSYGKEEPDANATAFFISEDGLAVTNHHSIEDALYVVGTLSTGETVEVERVLAYDADIDFAVVQMSKPTDDSLFAYFDILPSDSVYAGDVCYSLSNPLGLGVAITSGEISNIAGEAAGYALDCIVNTATISQGSSGGALINQYGDAIGITAGAYTYGNNMYLAVPLDPVIEADLSVEGWTLAELVAMAEAELED